MKTLNILFIGVGSIAKRHIHNLYRIAEDRDLKITIDAFRHSNSSSIIEGVNKVYFDLNTVPDNYDVIFITNPTGFHIQTLNEFHCKGKHFFIEKPVVKPAQIAEAKGFKTNNTSVYYVACPLRYSSVIRYIKEQIDPNSVYSVRCISSSFLPDWRPNIDYRNTYSAHKCMGGGVSIDLIHEWDYITYLFGWPNKVQCYKGKKSNLEIDSDDLAVYIAEYDTKVVELHLDYFGRKVIREIQLFTEDETIVGDLVNNKVHLLTANKEISFAEQRNDYQINELNYFLDLVSGKNASAESLRKGIRLLELAQGIINYGE